MSSVCGSEGGISLDPFGYYHTIGDMQADTTIDLNAVKYRWDKVDEIGNVYDSPQHHWIAALAGRVDLLPTAELALNTMLISEGIYRSQELDRELTTEEIRDLSISSAIDI